MILQKCFGCLLFVFYFAEDYDWMRILRFGLFGGCYVAPTLYGWLRVASTMWPQTNLRVGALKVGELNLYQ